MGTLWNFYCVSMIFYGVSKGMSMVFVRDSNGLSKGCLQYGISFGFLWGLHEISMGFLLGFP